MAVDEACPPSMVRVFLKRLKTDQLGQGVAVFLGTSNVHSIGHTSLRRQTRRTESRSHILSVIEAITRVATMAQKPLATAAANRKVDLCSRFSEHQTRHHTG